MLTPIGKLDKRAVFEDPGPNVPDGEGGYLESWIPLTTEPWPVLIRPATVRDLERETAGTIVAHATHIVAGRYLAGVSTLTRIRWEDYAPNGSHKTRIFQVNGFANLDERDKEMALFCEEQLTPAPPARTRAAPPGIEA